MESNGMYSLTSADSDVNFADVYRWWDCDLDESETRRKKKKKRKKKSGKKYKKELKYRLIEKSANVALCTVSDIARMYAESKFRSFGGSK